MPSKQELLKEEVKGKIKEIHKQSFEIYGAVKIEKLLKKSSYKTSLKTVSNYMSEMDIKARYIKKYIVTTKDSDFGTHLANILDREYNPSNPNELWCTDITYIWTKSGFVYLTSVMDLFSKKIIFWVISNSLDSKAVVKCIEKAKKRRNLSNPVIIHCDRGIQYVSRKYYEVLGEQLIPSYSRKANPWDNACIESFHALIKREWIQFYDIQNITHAKAIVFEYIETFYNTVRIHGSCDYKSPTMYEKQHRLNKDLKNKYRLGSSIENKGTINLTYPFSWHSTKLQSSQLRDLNLIYLS